MGVVMWDAVRVGLKRRPKWRWRRGVAVAWGGAKCEVDGVCGVGLRVRGGVKVNNCGEAEGGMGGVGHFLLE